MKKILRQVAGRLPAWLQGELRRYNYIRQIKGKQLASPEPEFSRLSLWLGEGDWAIDVGANVGQYTLRFSEIVGAAGRVVAFEPVPQTFQLLAANAAHATHANITLINAAASDAFGSAGMAVPRYQDGLHNFYQAHITTTTPAPHHLKTLRIPLDSLELPHAVALVKIDAEGHDLEVLKGMRRILQNDRPTLIVENGSSGIVAFLAKFGYASTQLEGSPNLVFASVPTVSSAE